jgi:hypothetical protein
MSRPPRELKHYTHKILLDELNEFMIRIKIYLHINEEDNITPQEVKEKLFQNHTKPTIKEIDSIHHKLDNILRQDTYSKIKY